MAPCRFSLDFATIYVFESNLGKRVLIFSAFWRSELQIRDYGPVFVNKLYHFLKHWSNESCRKQIRSQFGQSNQSNSAIFEFILLLGYELLRDSALPHRAREKCLWKKSYIQMTFACARENRSSPWSCSSLKVSVLDTELSLSVVQNMAVRQLGNAFTGTRQFEVILNLVLCV